MDIKMTKMKFIRPIPNGNDQIKEVLKILDESNWTNTEQFLKPYGGQRVTIAHLAAYRGNLKILKRIADIDATDYFGRCALHYAADQGHVDVIKWLLKRPAADGGPKTTKFSDYRQLSRLDTDGMTALHLALRAGHVDVAKVLLKAHVEEAVQILDKSNNVNAEKFLISWNVQPIHLAAYRGNLEVLKKAADLNAPDKLGRRALHYAASQGNLEVIKYLLEHLTAVQYLTSGMDHSDTIMSFQDSFGMTPLHYAADQGHMNIVKHLLARCKVVPPKKRRYVRSPLRPRKEFGGTTSSNCISQFSSNDIVGFIGQTRSNGMPHLLHSQDILGRTALHLAVIENNVDVVKFLVENGANADAHDRKNLTPFLLAHTNIDVSNNEEMAQYEDIVDILLSAGASVMADDPATGWNVLHYAVLLNSQKATQRLSECRTNLILCGSSKTGDTPVHLAAVCKSNEALCILLKDLPFCSIDKPNKKGWSPLHCAAFAGNLKSVRALIAKGGNLAKKNFDGNTTIDLLSKLNDNVDLVAFFIDILDANIYLAEEDDHNAVLTDFGSAKLDFEVLAPRGDEHDNVDAPQMAVVSALINALPRKDQIRILQHPLPKAFISKKWTHLRYVFYSHLIIQFLLALDFSVYAIYIQNDSWALLPRRMLFFLAGIPFCCNLLRILTEPKHYFGHIENWLSLLCLTISITVAVSGEFGSLAMLSWIPYHVSVATPLLWIQTMLLAGRFSGWVFYALIFPTVLKNFLKVSLIGLSIIVGFAISFMVLFDGNDAFDNFWKAIVKTVVMMTGEYDYGTLFGTDTESTDHILGANANESPYLPIISRAIFLIFAMLSSIVMMNLMIGLAISDIQGLLQEGQFGRMLKQAEFIANCERMTRSWIFSSGYLSKKLKSTISPKSVVFSPTSRPTGFYKNLIEDLSNLNLKRRESETKSVHHSTEHSLAAIQSALATIQSSHAAVQSSLAIMESLQKKTEQQLQKIQIQQLAQDRKARTQRKST